jgi:hypothetical protein
MSFCNALFISALTGRIDIKTWSLLGTTVFQGRMKNGSFWETN